MASFADLRPIIVIVCFSGFFALFLGGFGLGGATPADMLSTTAPTIKGFPTAADMFSFISNGTWVYLNGTDSWTSTGTLNNGTIETKLYTVTVNLPVAGRIFQVDTFRTAGIGPFTYQTDFEHFIWYTNSSMTEQISINCAKLVGGQPTPYHGIYDVTLDGWYTYYGNISGLSFFISNSRTFSNVHFAFNSTLYASPTIAWNANALCVSFDAGYTEVPSSSNALSAIRGILTWSIPGVPSWVYMLVSLAVGAPIVYVIAIWILRIIGSVFGGGGGG